MLIMRNSGGNSTGIRQKSWGFIKLLEYSSKFWYRWSKNA